jgi:hypothetical protein
MTNTELEQDVLPQLAQEKIHLRKYELTPIQLQNIASLLAASNYALKSISFSYSKREDAGLLTVLPSFPSSIQEIGLVGCELTGASGEQLLAKIKLLPHLSMLCIEQNRFSQHLKNKFLAYGKSQQILVIV